MHVLVSNVQLRALNELKHPRFPVSPKLKQLNSPASTMPFNPFQSHCSYLLFIIPSPQNSASSSLHSSHVLVSSLQFVHVIAPAPSSLHESISEHFISILSSPCSIVGNVSPSHCSPLSIIPFPHIGRAGVTPALLQQIFTA